jgi:hypothetical protein
MSSPYSHYKGQSVGRVIHAFWIYNGGYNSIQPDEIQIGNLIVSYHSKLLAYYHWKKDVPVFDFSPMSMFDEPARFRLSKMQFFKRPFLDNPDIECNMTYAVQELRNVLSFTDLTFIVWVRDKWNNSWKDVIFNRPNLKDEVQRLLNKVYFDRLSDDFLEKYWWHFCLCAAYGITNEENNVPD